MLTSRPTVLAVVAAGAALALCAGALPASGWPLFGGDDGRSGHEVADVGGPPVTQHYQLSGDGDRDVRTSPIVTADRRTLLFGTGDGRLHARRLADGSPGGYQPGRSLDDNPRDDADVFSGADGSVTPVDLAPGRTVAVLHNDDDQDGRQSLGDGQPDPRFGADVAIAFVDAETGAVVDDVSVGSQDPAQEDTINMTISSSPLAGPQLAGAPEERDVYFVASRAAESVDPVANQTPCNPNASFDTVGPGGVRGCNVPAEQRLFRVRLTGLGTPMPAVGSVASVAVPAANPLASPTMLRLTEGEGDAAVTVAHVAVATTDGFVRTYRADTLAAGPASEDLGLAASTPSVPVRAGGGEAPAGAPLYVAVAASSNTFRVHELRVSAGAPAVLAAETDADRSPELSGAPGRGLAVSALAGAAAPGGRVVVGSARNLYSLDPDDLREGARLALTDDLAAGTTGFTRTVPALRGGLAYIARDNGRQLVLDERTLEPPAGFQPFDLGANANPTDGFGQPALARGYAVFGQADGVFAYRDDTAPEVELLAPEAGAALTGTVKLRARAHDVRSGVAAVTFLVDGTPVGDGELVSGSPSSPGDPGVYELDLDTTALAQGTHLLGARATDADAGPAAPPEVASTAERRVVVDHPAPAPTPTPTPAPPGPAPTPPPVGTAPPPLVKTSPARLGLRVRPRRDRRPPLRFRATGTLTVPAGADGASRCSGRVDVEVRAGRRLVLRRRTSLRADCTFSVRLQLRRRPARARSLTLRARFRGTDRLGPRSSSAVRVRVR